MPHRSRSSRSAAAGFTLAECLVAITLFSIGLLGITGTELAVERIGAAGTRRAEGAAVAWSRMEELRGMPCASRTGGATTLNGVAERWSVVTSGGATAVQDSVVLPPVAGRAAVSLSLESALPC